ncbi:MAG: UvrD-helicase domain-containing protein [Deltaproteobacteria bacterium]|nr:UvrD-helicase domain-containing protein [Deltaproteobacteria bacterium]
MNDRILGGLNPEQERAVRHVNGPILIFAGAGSGKTRVIVHRVAYLISQGISPREILCLTFTNKAAGEMKERLKAIMGRADILPWAGTFHAFGAWLLRQEAHRIGLPSSFVIYDEADQRSLMGKCRRELNINSERGTDASLAWLANYTRDTMKDLTEVAGNYPFNPQPVLELYEKRKRENKAVDFADLLYVPCVLFSDYDDLKQKYRSRFRYILVDEYQDTNTAQYVFLMNLAGDEANICVVGDDDQSIYGWRGANVDNILKFRDDFPNAEVVVLEQNYRSTEEILGAASALIANNQCRAPKRLKSVQGRGKDITVCEHMDDEKEAGHTAIAIENLIRSGVSPRKIGVFYRVNALSRVLEEAFVRRRIPYAVYGGMRFYERREVKDLLAYLRILVNPADTEALDRIINVPSRGVGEKTLAALKAFARKKGIPAVNAIEDAVAGKIVRGAGLRGIESFGRVYRELARRVGMGDVALLLSQIIETTGFGTALKAEVDGEDRLNNVRELIASAQDWWDIGRYLEEKALMSAVDMDAGESVSVMTLHMSKGLEFDHVFILGLEEGLLPHARSMDTSREIEEERRLLYVGITRARREVTLSWSRQRTIYGREVFQVPSGFLSELVSGELHRKKV